MIYYVISFPLTLILRHILVKNLLLMTFIYVYISLRTPNILKINHRCLKEVISQLRNVLYYNELLI